MLCCGLVVGREDVVESKQGLDYMYFTSEVTFVLVIFDHNLDLVCCIHK